MSSGFAIIHPSNLLTINAVEAHSLESFSPEVRRAVWNERLTQAARQGLAEAQRVLSSGASAEEKAAAEVEVEVYTAIQDALAQRS